MKDLMTRKIVLGLLMTLVLAFSVQGIADAADLPLSKTSGDLQTHSVDDPFEISFRVGIRSNTTSIRNEMNRLISETSALIDSSGYPVFYATNGTAYRTLGTQPSGTFYRREVAGDTGTTGNNPDDDSWIKASGTFYVTSSRYVHDANGRAVYEDQGLSRQLRVPETSVSDQVGHAAQYHYNQESITIALDSTGSSTGVAMTFKLKASGFQRDITGLTEVPGSDPNAIPSSVTLICTPSGTPEVGTYKVRITDATPASDTPWTKAPTPRAYIEFTLYVVDEATLTIAPTDNDDDIFYAGETLRIDDDFTVTGTGGETALIHYEVLSGPGTIFERTSPDDTTSPAKSHLTSTSAQVYLILNNGNSVVRGTISGQDPVKDGVEIEYTYTGDGAPTNNQQQNQQQQQQQQQARLLIDVSGTGATRSVTVNAVNAAGTAVSGIGVTLGSPDFTLSQAAFTGTPVSITVPTTGGPYTIFARHPTNAYAPATATVTIAAPTLGTLTISPSGVPVNGVQNVSITLRTADATIPSETVPVSLSGTGFSPTSVPVTGGFAVTGVVLPATTGTYTLNATATGYDPASIRLTVGTPTTPTTQPGTTPTTRGPAGTPSSIRIASEPFPSGTANRQLAQPLSARVLDANGNGVASVRVTFQVVSGQGRLSQRGNGRAVRVETDRNGNARANYTPLADGTSTVRATAAGVTQTVTFTITAGAGAPSTGTTTPRDTGTGTTQGAISPDVHVGKAQRPPMLWVDGGAIYALVGADVERFAPGVDNALNIAVGGGKVYWTEQTGESSGTINSADLDGSDVEELKAVKAVPMGIAVDTAGDKLYWTNSRGRIQSADLDGSGIKNVMVDLPGPMDIAVARGNLYWTQYDATAGAGGIGITNTAGRGTPKYIATGSDMPGSIVIGGNKVYWTEMTGSNSGTINSANLNGSGAEELNDIRAVPMGIAVDSSRSKLYWTNSRGRVQSANLDGRKIQSVVEGLGNPGDMVLSNSIEAPVAGGTSTGSGTTDSNKYDVNGDGSVDGKDVDALIVAVAAGVTAAKYDVNGDGNVDIFDVSAVSSNRDDGAASAPTLLGTKLSIVQIDRLKEQIDLLIASGDRSPDAMRILTYLQQLIVMARPEKTQLLANYPNPFNPETWIPYELATDTTVKITIYNTQGVVIRTLELGHQSAGYYTGRDRAAYWDGRNAFGEQVASGIYFYQFETDEMSSMRKMVILK